MHDLFWWVIACESQIHDLESKKHSLRVLCIFLGEIVQPLVILYLIIFSFKLRDWLHFDIFIVVSSLTNQNPTSIRYGVLYFKLEFRRVKRL